MSDEQKEIQSTTETKNETSSYRSIFKATSLFAGVQIWQILISVVQTKFVALILGPGGMGIKGLYSSATSFIQSITSMGLSSSAIRDVSQANGTGDVKRVSYVVAVLRKLVWITGLLGMTTVIVLSPVLSKTTFGDYSYTIPFIILSVTLLFSQLNAGQNVILRGTRKLKYMATASIIGSIVSLVITVPFYYLWGVKGIVPTMVLESFSLLFLVWYFARKVKFEPAQVTIKESLKEGRGMMSLGLVMTYNSMLVLGCSYLIRIFITRVGGIADVGLYNAGFAVVNTYVGLVFSAMTTDFYPRLAAVCQDNEKCGQVVNQQLEVALLIVGPMLLFFLLVAPWAVIALYSQKFLPIVGYMKWAALGIVFKTISWAVSYQFIAKGDKKTFAINETLANIVTIILNMAGYYLWGITGLGITFLVSFFLYMILVFCIAHKKYDFNLSKGVIKIINIQLLCLIPVFLLLYLWNSGWSYLPSAFILLAGCYYSYRELDKRLNLKEAVQQIRKKGIKK